MRCETMLFILRALFRQDNVTAPELASELGVSERTVYRYMDELTVSGIPINTVYGSKGGFRLEDEYKKNIGREIK